MSSKRRSRGIAPATCRADSCRMRASCCACSIGASIRYSARKSATPSMKSTMSSMPDARDLAVVGPLVEHALEQLRRTDDVGAGLLEQVEEHALPGGEELGQSGHGGPVYVTGLSGRQADAAVRRAHHA